jgi:DNA-binding NtrC family response regulator
MSAVTRILVVDDHAMMLNAITQMLSREGYEVFSALGPRQALEIVKNNSPHLVLSDIVMPEMRGTQLVHEVLQLSPRTAVVLMTGYVPGTLDVPVGVPLLRKPFTSQELFHAVEAALGQSS